MITITKYRDIKNVNTLLEEAKSLIEKIEYLIKFNSDEIRFTLSEELTEEEDSSLDSLIENFLDNDPEFAMPLIISYAKAEAATKHFHNINYKTELTVRLQKQSIILKGELQKVTWFRYMEYQTINGIPTRVYSVPVLKTETSWLRDASGFAIAKNPPVRTWYNEDGTENSEVKVMDDPYYYEDFEQIDEGVKRRTLLVKAIQKPTQMLIAEVMMPLGMSLETVLLRGREFLDDYDLEFNKFKQSSSSIIDTHLEDGNINPEFNKKSIVVKLQNEQKEHHKEWLDKIPLSLGGIKSIRDYLVSEFDI